MKKLLFYSALVLGSALASPTLVDAQDQTPRQRLERAQQRSQQAEQPDDAAARLDSKTTGATMRVSELTGMGIKNLNGEDIGEIEDLVVDAKSGKVRYAAVSYGGILGIGDELFAVPFEAFKFRQDADDAEDIVLVLDVSKQQLEGAQGFDKDNWPNFADRKFTDELDQRYKIKRRRPGNADVDIEVRTDQDN